jgi:predicted amino acid dehydrogenase
MDSFAFIIHPLDAKADVARKYPWLGNTLPVGLLHSLSRLWPPVVLSHAQGIRSPLTGREIEGWLLACPLTTAQMVHLPPRVVYRKIAQTARLAEKLGARIVGLGAYTSVVGDGGVTLARMLDIPVTTGDSYTVVLALRALFDLGDRMGIDPGRATAAVVGATGAIGSACARLLAPQVSQLILVGRRENRLAEIGDDIQKEQGITVECTTDLESIKRAQLIVSATSAARPIIQSEHLTAGAVVCDVALPRDVSPTVALERDDVLVVDGGLAEPPTGANFDFDYRLPDKLTFGCMAETMALALEGRFEDYTVGKNLELDRIDEIERIADKHGFRLGAYRTFNQALADEQINTVRHKAGRAFGDA